MAHQLKQLTRRWTAARAAERFNRRQKRANGWRAEHREPSSSDSLGLASGFVEAGKG
jgi:hypothetical protein